MSNELEDRHRAFFEKLYGIKPGDYWKQVIDDEPAMVTLGIFGRGRRRAWRLSV
jgi:hypothetical protein